MKKNTTLLAALAVTFAATAATVRTATETFVTNRIAAAVAAIPSPDYSTNNTELVEMIETVAPQPGDYATVSNLAVHAVQTETDPTVPGWAKASSKPGYSYSEISGTPSTWPWSALSGVPAFAAVATSGAYSDLTGTPTLATVATSGAYADLTGTPTIPTVPTAVSAFANDAGYLTAHQSLSGYATETWVGNQGYLTSYTESDPAAAGIASNVVTQAYIQEKLGVYLYIGQDGGIYVHTPTQE